MITNVWLENYGPFERAEFHLTPLTVVVGPNASGKSTLLRLLLELGGLYRRRLDWNQHLTHMMRKGAAGRSVSVGYERSDGLKISRNLSDKSDISMESRFAHLNENPPGRAVFLELRPERLREPSYLNDPKPLILPDGYGLATALAYLKLNGEATFQAVLEQTRRIVPNFAGVRFRRTQVVVPDHSSTIYGDELIFDMQGASELPPAQVSDGTLLTLGLLTAALQHSSHEFEAEGLLLLIDELEHGLHPRALGELVGQLHTIAETNNLQILATSHSPYLLDALKPEEVRLTGLLENGNATIRNLTDHPDFERWRDQMSPGEFWSYVGEDWIR